ncbi:MAG: hypothetical protein JST05_09460 [Acidobacteria bacterium]|nr:hypothetical protein [Acidobacteriota bacterium]
MDTLSLDPVLERARYEARLPLLQRQAALRVDLAPGIFLQPETLESVADQVRETLWAEGMTADACDPRALAEVEASFSVLSPRREERGWSVAATVMIGVDEVDREGRLRDLEGFPESLRLELADGRLLLPTVDKGSAPEGARLPAVLALRWMIPGDGRPESFRSVHPTVSGRWPAPYLEAWTAQ